MLAALGYPLAEVFHPLFGGNIDTPSFIAFQQTPLQTFWPAVVCERAVELGMVFPQVCPGTFALFQGQVSYRVVVPADRPASASRSPQTFWLAVVHLGRSGTRTVDEDAKATAESGSARLSLTPDLTRFCPQLVDLTQP